MSKNQQKNSSSTPLIFIGVVLAIAVIGGYWLYNTSAPANTIPVISNSAAANNNTPNLAANAPAGAPLGVNVAGSATAVVTVEEFADYQCGSCAQAHPILKEIKSIYGSRIKFIFRHYPLPGHDKSYDASVATEAAGLQGPAKFWQFQDLLFQNQHVWSRDPNFREIWLGYAKQIGLDVEKFKADMAGVGTKSRVDQDLQRGRGLGVSSTPTVFINDKPVHFQQINVAALRQLIDTELQAAPSTNKEADANVNTEAGNASSNSQ